MILKSPLAWETAIVKCSKTITLNNVKGTGKNICVIATSNTLKILPKCRFCAYFSVFSI